ncbi:hypothetical protein [Archangium sp.]
MAQANAHRLSQYVSAAGLVDNNEGARAVPALTEILQQGSI